MNRIKKGDTVVVLQGRDRGKTGKVLQIWPQTDKALVENINLLKHFERRTQQNQTGGIVDRETPVPLSKIAPQCPKCKKPARVSFSIGQDSKKKRLCKRCNETI